MIQWMLAIWSLVLLTFLIPTFTSGSSPFTYCLKPSLKDFEHNLASMCNECWQLCGNLNILGHCFSLGLEWKLAFSSPVATCWVFQICWHIECSTFTASSFRIWNSSTGIPSPPLALFVVMLSKAHLTSHSRMSGSRSVITPSWLFGSWRSFLYSSSVYSYHLFLISSASVRSIPFLSFIEPICAWNVPLVSLIFLKRSLVFPNPFCWVRALQFSHLFRICSSESQHRKGLPNTEIHTWMLF